MSLVTLRAESLRQAGFYVPAFEIKITGANLPQDVVRDVIQVTYKDNIREIDSVEFVVNNWDTTARAFKYVGSETPASLQGSSPESQRQRLFDPCRNDFELYMGYQGDLRLMTRGDITTLEPSFPSNTAPVLTVRGLNVLHRLRRKQYTTFFEHRRDSEIARRIAALRDPDTHERRFPIPIDIDQEALGREHPEDYVAQNNQYDIDFLLARARERGYVVFVHPVRNPRTGRVEDHLYFGPSHTNMHLPLRDVTYVLEYGTSLVEFKPTMNVANQVGSVTLRSWNRRTRRRIRETVTLQDRRIRINRDLIEMLGECNLRSEVVTRQPAFCDCNASLRALSMLLDKFKELVTATGVSIGLPNLRAGQRVRIEGVGSRFGGTYFITETTHTCDDNGYLTRFSARRESQ